MSSQPNVLLISTDELHREALSYYGATSHQTPNIDDLARQSTVYDRTYTASPICLPSRCALATGLFPHNNRSISNQTGASLNQDLPNIFSVFKQAGYSASMHGKCHFVPVPYRHVQADFTQEYEHFHMYYRSLGIDHLDLQDGNAVSAWFYDDYSKDLERDSILTPYRNLVHNRDRAADRKNLFLFPGPADMQPDAWVGRKAVEHIQSREQDTPHFMWVSFSGPHYPQNPPEEYLARIDMDKDTPRRTQPDEWDDRSKSNWFSYHGPSGTEGSGGAPDGAQKNFNEAYWREWRQMYYANVVQIDDMVGELIAAAREKWGDNLLVIFTADHGDMMGHHDIWGKNGAFYEDILRVPLFVQLPGESDHTVRDEYVSLIDLLPTCIDVCGLPTVECDGQPLAKWVEQGGRDYIIASAEGLISVIQAGNKLTCHQRPQNGETYYELYDLEHDPYEFINLYDAPSAAAVQKQLEYIIETLQERENMRDVLFFDKASGEKPPWLV